MAKYRVPASTSNLGPGFDSLGLALSLYNTTEVVEAETFPEDLFLQTAAKAFFQATGKSEAGFRCEVKGEVPRSRGLGSSVTVRLGVLAGLNELHGGGLSSEDIFRLCAKLEGHPDNAAASCFGGFTICLPDGGWRRFPVDSRLKFLLVVPEKECSTEAARRAVPTSFSREDAVFNLSYAAALAACLASGRYGDLPELFADRIHQPARGQFLPHLEPLLEAGVAAGALGGWLSGSGSSVAIVTLDRVEEIRTALAQVPGADRVLTLQADNEGLRGVPSIN
jgi:homoserine kinase